MKKTKYVCIDALARHDLALRRKERIETLEEVQKQFRRKNYEWFAFRKWLEQQLKEAKGDESG